MNSILAIILTMIIIGMMWADDFLENYRSHKERMARLENERRWQELQSIQKK